MPLSTTGAELLFEVFSQRYERGSILVTTYLPFDGWTEVPGPERVTGALLDRLTHHMHILEMNSDSRPWVTGPQRRKSKTWEGPPEPMLVSSAGAAGLSLNSDSILSK